MAEPSGSPPGRANRNCKQSITVTPNPIRNPYNSRNPFLRWWFFDFSRCQPPPSWIFKMWKF